MNIKRFAACTLALTLAFQLVALPVALAQEQPTAPIENEDGTLSIITETSGTEASEPPSIISHNNKPYVLEETTQETNEGAKQETQNFTHSLFSEVPIEGINNLGAYFPATVTINEGDYQGEIGLDAQNPYTITERHEVIRTQVDKSTVFYNLPDNDVIHIPTHQAFEVSSSAYPGATTQATLQILDVAYEVTGTDHLGFPNNYTAYVTYRGQEEYAQLHHYDVTANYAGELISATDATITTGTYAPAPSRTEQITASEVPLAAPSDSGIPLVPLAITGATVVVLVMTPLLLIFFLNNARLVRVETNEKSKEALRNNQSREQTQEDQATGSIQTAEPQDLKIKKELICRRRLVMREGIAEFRIPANVDIFDGATYCVAIKPHFASREGMLCMVWQDKIVAQLPLSDFVDIDFRELLISSVETALIQGEILD